MVEENKNVTEMNSEQKRHYEKLSKMSVKEREEQYSQIEVIDRISKAEIENAYSLIGTNHLMSNYGSTGKEYGTPSFVKSIGSKYAQDKKLQLMSSKTEKNKSLGIDWYLPDVSDQELNTHLMELAQEAFSKVKLTTLEGILSEKNKQLDFSGIGISKRVNEIEEKSRNYEIAEGKKYELTEEEKKDLAYGQNHRETILAQLKESSALQIQAFQLQNNHGNYIEQMKTMYPGKEQDEQSTEQEEQN